MRSILPLFIVHLALAAPALAAETIALPNFKSVQLNGGGEVVFRPGSVQRVTLVSGSRQYTEFRMLKGGRLKIDACNQRCPQRYKLQIVIESPTVPIVAINGGGSIAAADGFRSQAQIAAAISGGGQIDLRSVPANTVAAAIDGGGRIRVRPTGTLAGTVNGGGLISYRGDPRVTSVINGGGAIRREDNRR